MTYMHNITYKVSLNEIDILIVLNMIFNYDADFSILSMWFVLFLSDDKVTPSS